MQCAKMARKQYNSMDLAKFIMAFAVIAIHTDPLGDCDNAYVIAWFESTVGMAVPFFFLASGYLLAKKLPFPYSESDIPVIRRSWIKSLNMYLKWMLIYTPLSLYHSVVTKIPPVKAAAGYIRGLFLVGEQYNSWHLWYLLSTVYTLMLVMLLFRMHITPRRLLLVGLLFSAISFGADWLVGVKGDMPAVCRIMQEFIRVSTCNGRILRGMIYIPIGMYLAHKPLPKLANEALFVIGFALNLFVEGWIGSYMLMMSSIGLFGIIEGIRLKDHPVYPWLRQMSTIIYLIHMYVWSFYYQIVYGEKMIGMDCFLVTSLVSCVIALAYLMIKRKRDARKNAFC